MEVTAASLHRLVVNAKLLQSVNSVGAEFHTSHNHLTMFSSDPTTLVTDFASWVDNPTEVASWFWTPAKLKDLDLVLREIPDDDIIDLAKDTTLPVDTVGDYQVETYLELLDRNWYGQGPHEFTVWGDRLRKLNLIKPSGEYPVSFESVYHLRLGREMLAFRVGPTVRGIVTVVEKE